VSLGSWHYIRYWYDINRYRPGRGGLDHMADTNELSETDYLQDSDPEWMQLNGCS
jgi:hypothetical protein